MNSGIPAHSLVNVRSTKRGLGITGMEVSGVCITLGIFHDGLLGTWI